MSAPIRIGDREFGVRRESYEDMLAREDLDEREGAAVDEANGLTVEFRHANNQLLALAEKAGEFDTKARDALKARRAELRKAARAAARELFRIRIEALSHRLDPTPEVDWLLANLDEDTLEEVTAEVNERPTKTGSYPESDES